MEIKKCSRCNKELSIDSFGSRKGKAQSFCKECQRRYAKEHYKKNKEYYASKAKKRRKKLEEDFLEFKKGLKCEKCGDERWYVLQFHHTNSNEKEYHIAYAYTHLSKEKFEKELIKCKVLCSNCHIEHHYFENAPLDELA